MKTYTVTSFEDLHKFLSCFRPHGGVAWCYRGQSNVDWPLLPAAGRPEYHTNRDLGRFNFWRKQAIAFHQNLPTNDWECLAFAQHHGLATRLLDWTINPLVAAFFASAAPLEKAGVIYCYFPQSYVRDDVLTLEAANASDQVLAYIPRALNPRVVRQAGLFTYHPEPEKPLTPGTLAPELGGQDDLLAIHIPPDMKAPLRDTLNVYGINEVTLFPDLDGLSRFVNWETRLQVDNAIKRKNKGLDQ